MSHDVLGAAEVCQRYGIARSTARKLFREWDAAADGPRIQRRSMRYFVERKELEEWDAAQLAAGRPLPGRRPSGPRTWQSNDPRPDN